jgi:hypothetical protein
LKEDHHALLRCYLRAHVGGLRQHHRGGIAMSRRKPREGDPRELPCYNCTPNVRFDTPEAEMVQRVVIECSDNHDPIDPSTAYLLDCGHWVL